MILCQVYMNIIKVAYKNTLSFQINELRKSVFMLAFSSTFYLTISKMFTNEKIF